MKCNEFQNLWTEALDEGLAPEKKREWETHRDSCPACREELESLDSLQHQLRGIPPANPPPPVFWNRQTESIMKKIEAAPGRRLSRLWEALFQPRGAFAAAALALLIFFGYRYFSPTPLSDPADENQWALQLGDEEEIEQGSWDLDLTEEQLDDYYAYLAQKYFPQVDLEDEFSEKVWIEDLDEQGLDQAIQFYEKNSGRRTL